MPPKVVFFVVLAMVLTDGASADKIHQLHRVMQLVPQVDKADAKNTSGSTEHKRHVSEGQQNLYFQPVSTNQQQPFQSNEQLLYIQEIPNQAQYQSYYPDPSQYLANPEQRIHQNLDVQYYPVPSQQVGNANQDLLDHQDNYRVPVVFTYQPNEKFVQNVQYEAAFLQDEQNKNEHDGQKKFTQISYENTSPQLTKDLNYIPLHYLVNNLVEPVKPTTKAETFKYGKQPTMPVYHYFPVPKGTFPDTSAIDLKDERIKETQPSTIESTETPDENQYKNDDHHDFSMYDFGYRVTDHEKGVEMGKVESKVNGLTKGNYHVLLPDGRLQIVKYWSDHSGYHTEISYRPKSSS